MKRFFDTYVWLFKNCWKNFWWYVILFTFLAPPILNIDQWSWWFTAPYVVLMPVVLLAAMTCLKIEEQDDRNRQQQGQDGSPDQAAGG